jgi:uncharacterized protein YegL
MTRHGLLSVILVLSACGGDVGLGSPSQPGQPPSAPSCQDPAPLEHGDITWASAPFEMPGAGEPSEDEDHDDGVDDWPGGGGFIDTQDGGTATFECDLWGQDCPEGQKCMPWDNTGQGQWNASKCTPLDPDPAQPGQACQAEGSGFSGVDDCQRAALCWEPDEDLAGTCVGFCEGSEAAPLCSDPGAWCWIGPGGLPSLCLPDTLCDADGVCRCMCPEGADPDCAPDQCAELQRERERNELRTPPSPVSSTHCPESTEPVVLYMSNDDSNSQASPTLARRRIREGLVIKPQEIKIYEFLNYYDLRRENPTDRPLSLDIQMRRSDGAAGEFTLLLAAQGRAMSNEQRPAFNLVFSLDTSGSMSGERIELLKETMTASAGSLRAGDVVSVVTWSSSQHVPLDRHVVTGPFDPKLVSVIESLSAGGSTDFHGGLTRAYALANETYMKDGINRVVLISDGGANTGVTDIDLISSHAHDGDGEGIYLVGVGVGTAHGYHDKLMDDVTEAGKGAYIFVDDPAEAWRSFDTHFLANMGVAAREVRMKVTLPWYFGMRSFHGEEYSPSPEKVEPQHLAPNDTMAFHQIIGACDPSQIVTCDIVTAEVTYRHPISGETLDESLSFPIGSLVERDASLLRKADAIVAYAKSLIVIGHFVHTGRVMEARRTAHDMAAWLLQAAVELDDDELEEASEVMHSYAESLDAKFG